MGTWLPGTSSGRRARDAGRVSIFLAIATVGIIAIIGVAVDASGQYRTLMRAQNLAAEAARAAGQGIDGPEAMLGNQVVVDPNLAAQYADQYLDQAFATIDQSYRRQPVELVDGGNAVRVTVTLVYDTQILGLFGINDIEVTAASTATLVTG